MRSSKADTWALQPADGSSRTPFQEPERMSAATRGRMTIAETLRYRRAQRLATVVKQLLISVLNTGREQFGSLSRRI
jgi:hypothetical protein